METRILGKDLKVSAIGLGCMGLSHANGAPTEENEAVRLLREAVEDGYTFFDTAETYGYKEDPHHNEKLLGKAFHGMRDELVIATKFGVWFDFSQDPDRPQLFTDSRPETIRKSVDESLKRLNTDYESVLQDAIMAAIMHTAKQSGNVLGTLKLHIGMGLDSGDTEDNSLDIQIRIAEIDAEFKTMLQAIATDTVEDFDEQRATELMAEKSSLEQQLAQYDNAQQEKEITKSRLDEIFIILEGLENHPTEYDDRLVRQVLECVVVESKERIKVIFAGGLEVNQTVV